LTARVISAARKRKKNEKRYHPKNMFNAELSHLIAPLKFACAINSLFQRDTHS
jgi:hypothetical protein